MNNEIELQELKKRFTTIAPKSVPNKKILKKCHNSFYELYYFDDLNVFAICSFDIEKNTPQSMFVVFSDKSSYLIDKNDITATKEVPYENHDLAITVTEEMWDNTFHKLFQYIPITFKDEIFNFYYFKEWLLSDEPKAVSKEAQEELDTLLTLPLKNSNFKKLEEMLENRRLINKEFWDGGYRIPGYLIEKAGSDHICIRMFTTPVFKKNLNELARLYVSKNSLNLCFKNSFGNFVAVDLNEHYKICCAESSTVLANGLNLKSYMDNETHQIYEDALKFRLEGTNAEKYRKLAAGPMLIYLFCNNQEIKAFYYNGFKSLVLERMTSMCQCNQTFRDFLVEKHILEYNEGPITKENLASKYNLSKEQLKMFIDSGLYSNSVELSDTFFSALRLAKCVGKYRITHEYEINAFHPNESIEITDKQVQEIIRTLRLENIDLFWSLFNAYHLNAFDYIKIINDKFETMSNRYKQHRRYELLLEQLHKLNAFYAVEDYFKKGLDITKLLKQTQESCGLLEKERTKLKVQARKERATQLKYEDKNYKLVFPKNNDEINHIYKKVKGEDYWRLDESSFWEVPGFYFMVQKKGPKNKNKKISFAFVDYLESIEHVDVYSLDGLDESLVKFLEKWSKEKLGAKTEIVHRK